MLKPKKSTQKLAEELISQVYTTAALKQISDTLEDLTQNRHFKSHAKSIATDSTLTESQKANQLSYLLQNIDIPQLYDFLMNQVYQNQFWLFDTTEMDYFDNFVQAFQLATEQAGVIFFTTSIQLNSDKLKKIAEDLSHSFGYKVLLNHQVDPHILGGIQIRIENMLYDYSLKNKFVQFKRQWLSSLEDTNEALDRNPPDA